MAILETKTIQTVNDPSAIDQANAFYQQFFWNVQSVQITHVKDSHQEYFDWGSSVEVKTVTETTQYATITYNRDKLIPHYDDIVRLEKAYAVAEAGREESEHQMNRCNVRGKLSKGFLWILAGAFASIFFSFDAFSGKYDTATVILGILMILGGIALIGLVGYKIHTYPSRKQKLIETETQKYNMYKAQYDNYCADFENTKSELARISSIILEEMRNA